MKIKGKKHTITEIVMPLIFILILIIIRLGIPESSLPELREEQTAFDMNNLTALSHQDIGVVISEDAGEIIAAMNSRLQPVGSSAQRFYSLDDFLAYYDRNDTVLHFGVIFDNSTVGSNVSYVLRAAPELGLPDLDDLYASTDSCHPKFSNDPNTFHNNEMSCSCPARKYYDVGFAQLQNVVDAAIIKNQTGKDLVPKLSVVVFPKDSFTGNTEYLRSVVPLYMTIAFSPFVAYLCILIVGEKERKIKDAMKLMGLRESVYWLGWLITYGIFIILLALIFSVLLVVAKITPQANIFLLWVLFVLYGLSILTIAFLVTPFFNSAKAAGGFASLVSSLVSCLYYIAVYVQDVPLSVYYVMSLMSPTAFALGMDQAVYLDLVNHGISFDNFWGTEDSDTGYYFGSSVIMLGVDIVLYAILAFYFDNVIPGEYGRKRPPWFFLMPSFWCPKPVKRDSVLKHGDSIIRENASNPNFEKVSSNLVGREALRILKIRKVFSGCQKEEVVAVDEISLDIYEGQITAILGHNGAGKTTLLNMLVGLTEPTSGTATMYGLDIGDPNNYDLIWQMIGICPQQDVLFDELSPKHHLEFFGRIKGVPENDLQRVIDEILAEVDLTDRKDAPAGKISGGQKRKLSVGIALIGDPKIVILDEPTSGVDPYSRRRLWNLLQKSKKNRLIILTTHFMDEADILADRKAIITRGKVKCVGSSLFLKNKFGLGYHLTMVMEENFEEKDVTDMVHSFIPNGEMIRANNSELAYQLPFDQVAHFPDLLKTLDNAANKTGQFASLGLRSYGMSMTTLEEVFLKLGEEDNDDADGVSESSNESVNISTRRSSERSERQALAVQTLKTITVEYNWWQAFSVMVKMNILAVLRLPRQIISTVVVPIILIILTFYLMTITTTTEDVHEPVLLDFFMYPPQDLLIANNTGGDLEPLLDQFTLLGIPYDMFSEDYGALLDHEPHTFTLNISQFDSAQMQLTLQAEYNDTAQHSLPILINTLNSALLRLVTISNNPVGQSPSILISAEPLPRHTAPAIVSGTTMSAVLMIGFAYVMMTSVYAADSVDDRESKVKHQLQVSGLPFSVYWLSKFVGNFVLFCVALVATIIIIEAFQVDPFTSGAPLGILVLGYILYMITGLFFGYCCGFMFDKYESAQGFLPVFYMILGFAPYMAVCFSDMLMSDNGRTAEIMHCIFTILLPIYSPFGIIYYLDKVYTDGQWRDTTPKGVDYFSDEVIVSLVVLPLQGVLFYTLLWILDYRSGNGQWAEICNVFVSSKKDALPFDPVCDNHDVPANEDEDVTEERRRVQNLAGISAERAPAVIIHGLRKEFATGNPSSKKGRCGKKKKVKEPKVKVAVRNLTLAVQKGEVFGLLGPNGAGKTSALRTVVADEIPTKGRVAVAGYDMATDLKKAIRNIGYCPQHDALWKSVTVEEHLDCYANIRGIKRSMIPKVIRALLEGLQISQHAKKRTEALSGGTKRKLSYAISMLGDPKIVLLDEPSTGMDPQSKRYFWDTIVASFQGERGAILTTHAMEEADFLCSRVGIMVKGQLKCIGSTQHLKNKFGSGYILEAKIIANGDEREQRYQELERVIRRIFRNATIQEKFEDRVKYQIPQTGEMSLAEIFSSLEDAKRDIGIEEYSFSQTTLEQVFLEFAKQQEFEDNHDRQDLETVTAL